MHKSYAIRELHTSLLSQPAIQALHVLRSLDMDSETSPSTDYESDVMAQYPTLFKGLDKLTGLQHHNKPGQKCHTVHSLHAVMCSSALGPHSEH